MDREVTKERCRGPGSDGKPSIRTTHHPFARSCVRLIGKGCDIASKEVQYHQKNEMFTNSVLAITESAAGNIDS